MTKKVKKEFDAIQKALEYSKIIQDGSEIDLTIEVLWSAMNYLKNNPKSSIEDACLFGVEEWIK